MEITPGAILEDIVHGLSGGELAHAGHFPHGERLADGVMRLDYGADATFVVVVTKLDRQLARPRWASEPY